MAKSIIKEIIIILLLLLAVILALGVLFYDYIPNNKTVPSVQTYKTSDSVVAAMADETTKTQPTLVTYEITSEDLQGLQSTGEYNSGKANPFSTYEEPVNNTNEENNTPSVEGGNTGTRPSGNSSGNTFYSNTGTK